MSPRKALELLATICSVLCAFAAALPIAAAWPSPAKAQDGPAITPNTACGAAGVGRLLGRADPVARSASEAAGTYVNAEGYWATPCPLIATRGTQCGAPGVGYSDVTRGMLARDSANAAAGWRVDDAGKWVECNRPCPPVQSEAFRTWSQGDAVCTTYLRYDSDPRSPARDRGLAHGELGRWEQWLGSMRGVLHERCDNGVRTRTLTTCTPATECDTKVTHLGRYSYDARPPGKRVPNGATVQLVSADGDTWPATCVAGSWDVPSVRPGPPKPPPAPHVITSCRAQTSQFDVPDLGRRWVSVRQLTTPVGDQVIGETVGTPMRRPIPMICGADGRFALAPPAQPVEATESGAAEWQRIFDQLQRDSRRP